MPGCLSYGYGRGGIGKNPPKLFKIPFFLTKGESYREIFFKYPTLSIVKNCFPWVKCLVSIIFNKYMLQYK